MGDVPTDRVRGGRGCAGRRRAGPSRLRRNDCLVCRAAAPGSALVHDDLVAGRRLELEALHEAVVRGRDGSSSTCRQRSRSTRSSSRRHAGEGAELSTSYGGRHERGHAAPRPTNELAFARRRSRRCSSRRASSRSTRSTRSSSATSVISDRRTARGSWRAPSTVPGFSPTAQPPSRSSVTAASRERRWSPSRTLRDPQRRRLHAVLLLPVAGAGPAADLVQEPRLPRPYGGRAALCCASSASSLRRRSRSRCGIRRARCGISSCRTARAGPRRERGRARGARHARQHDRHRAREDVGRVSTRADPAAADPAAPRRRRARTASSSSRSHGRAARSEPLPCTMPA